MKTGHSLKFYCRHKLIRTFCKNGESIAGTVQTNRLLRKAMRSRLTIWRSLSSMLVFFAYGSIDSRQARKNIYARWLSLDLDRIDRGGSLIYCKKRYRPSRLRGPH